VWTYVPISFEGLCQQLLITDSLESINTSLLYQRNSLHHRGHIRDSWIWTGLLRLQNACVGGFNLGKSATSNNFVEGWAIASADNDTEAFEMEFIKKLSPLSFARWDLWTRLSKPLTWSKGVNTPLRISLSHSVSTSPEAVDSYTTSNSSSSCNGIFFFFSFFFVAYPIDVQFP